MDQKSGAGVRSLADRALEEVLRTWWQLPSGLSEELQLYSLQERLARGRQLERLVSQLVVETQSLPSTATEKLALSQRLVSGVASLGRLGLGWREDQIALLTDSAVFECLTAFGRQARAFDPGIGTGSLYQAGRNIALMAGLQVWLGVPVTLTRSMLGYSLLYPYSDNYLDDPVVDRSDKDSFGRRFAQWIGGADVPPENPTEERIQSLVNMIEDDLPRNAYPHVWESLELILEAQADSVKLVSDDASPYEIDVLRLSLAKGGASVLADGYLVAAGHKEIDAAWAGVLYRLGACLQLVDDMQDVQQDMAEGQQTIFSQTAVTWPLDGVANRAIQLARTLSCDMGAICDQPSPMAEMIESSITLLIINAIAETRRLYSRPYVLAVEDCSPFTFQALGRARRRLERQRIPLLGLAETLIAPEHLS